MNLKRDFNFSTPYIRIHIYINNTIIHKYNYFIGCISCPLYRKLHSAYYFLVISILYIHNMKFYWNRIGFTGCAIRLGQSTGFAWDFTGFQ